MAMFLVNTDALARVADSLSAHAASARALADNAATTMTLHGFATEAAAVSTRGSAAAAWGASWELSLRARLDLLGHQTGVTVGSGGLSLMIAGAALSDWAPTDARRQVFGGVPRSALHAPSPVSAVASLAGGAGPGAGLATELLDALEDGDLDKVEAVLARLAELLTDPMMLGEFFAALGPDMTGLFPQLVVDLGATELTLPGFVEPFGKALAVAATSGELPFDATDLFAGHEARAVTPAIYFDFGAFPLWFAQQAAEAVLGPFGRDELPLQGVDYELPDGGSATVDPRLALLRGVLAMDIAWQQDFVAELNGAGLLGAVVAPATPWGDEGEAAGRLLAVLGTDLDLAAPVAAVMNVVAAPNHPLAGLVVEGVATALAPHLGSLTTTRLGNGYVNLAETPLSGHLVDSGGEVVASTLQAIMSVDEAASVLLTALATLTGGTFSAHIDLDDPGALAAVTDDLGAVWGIVLEAQLAAALDEAATKDEGADLLAAAFGFAIEVGGGGASRLIAATGFGSWMTGHVLRAAELGGPVAVALMDAPTETEVALRRGSTWATAAADFVVFTLATELHAAGLIDLPEELITQGDVKVPRTDGEWEQLIAAIEAASLDPERWIEHGMAVAGYAVAMPRTG